MSKLGEPVCPFYNRPPRKLTLKCSLATFQFPDEESKAQIKAYCCDMNKYQACLLYQVQKDYWERKYKGLEGAP